MIFYMWDLKSKTTTTKQNSKQTNKQKNKLIDTDRLVFIRGGDCGSRNE